MALSIALRCVFTGVFALGESPIELFPAGAPGEVRDWPGPEATVIPEHFPGVTNISRPTIQPFLVRNGVGTAVIIAPGGGYEYLELQKEGTDVAKRFNKLGISAFVLKYRVPVQDSADGGNKRLAAPLQDVQRAFGVVRSRAAEFGVNASRLGILGFSAGSDIGATVSFEWQKRSYTPLDEADAESCRPDFSLLMYPGFCEDGFKMCDGAVLAASNPPLFMAQAADDPLIMFANGSLTYYGKAVVAGVPSPTLHVYPRCGHGFGICQQLAPGLRSFEECCEWPLHALRFLQDNGFMPGFPTGDSSSLI